MEKNFSIPNGNETIDAYIDFQDNKDAIIIMHPHSLMGGNMDNPIVQKAQQIFASKRLTTVRFNFRGVGYSTGVFDDGIGEQDDLKSVIDFLKTKGINQIDLIGYSFGSWVLAHAAENIAYHRAMMISPPVAFMDFSKIQTINNLKHVVVGSKDEFAPPDIIEDIVEQWNSDVRIEIITGADHFFSFHMNDIENVLSNWV